MNILNELTIKSLLLNKKRTLVTIIGIILSCALITGVVTLVNSFQNSLIDYVKKDYGDYHVIFKDVPKEEQKYITNNLNVEKYNVSKDLGYSKIDGLKNGYKPYLYLIGFTDDAFKNRGIKLEDGRLPENSDEIVISDHIEQNGGVTYNVGDKINLDISKRTSDGYELGQNNPYYIDEADDSGKIITKINNEQLVSLFKKEYTIVGKIYRPSFEEYNAPGYTILTHMDDNITDKSDIAVLIKNPKKVYDFVDSIVGDSKNPKYQYELNSDLLRFQGVTSNNAINNTMMAVSAILVGIIMITSIMVIRNSFSISITERVKQLGILSSIGATSKQIRKNILYEGFILSLIAIPIGVISGIFAIGIVLTVVNNILKDYLDGINLNLSISLISIVISIIVALFTIFISTIIPAIKASKISPIESIRSSNDIKVSKKKLKISKLYTKLFGVEGEIALKNLKRSRKKYRTTVLSIFISIVIFISLNSFINYGIKMSNIYYEEVGYNISVSENSNATPEENLEYFTKISKLDNVSNYTILKSKDIQIDKKYLSDKSKELFDYNDNDLNPSLSMISLGEKEYENYIKKIGGNLEYYKDKAILIDKNIITRDQKKYEFNFFDDLENKNIEVTTFSTEDYNVNEVSRISSLSDQKKINIQIAKTTDIVPLGIQASNIVNTAYLIVSDEYMDKLDYDIDNMYINSSNATKLEKDIEALDTKFKDNVYNQEEYIKENNATILVVSIFCYGFIGVISLIGVTNIFNTITTNVALRKGEFAVLKSIGMTDKEFRTMINFESLFYGLKSLIYGIPFGIILSYLIYSGFSYSYSTKYIIPYDSIIISIIFVFIIIFVTMNYSTKKLKNQNIIETIRNENI